MSSSVEMNNRLLCLLVLVAVAISHRAIAEQIDPPIPCATSEVCIKYSSTFKNPTCKNGYCLCENGAEMKNCSSQSVPQASNRNAVLSEQFIVRTSCKVDQNCVLENSFCNSTISQCECHKTYVLSTDKKKCLNKADSIDSPCVEDKQCLSFLQNTTCRNKKCSCIDGYHYLGNACYKAIEPGQTCTELKQCAHVDGAICTEDKVCKCGAETVISTNKKSCLKVASEMLTSCIEDHQCNITFPNSMCINFKCQCIPKFHYERNINQCVIDKGLDENCGTSYECYKPGDENTTTRAMQCISNTCVCTEGFQREEDVCISSESTRLLGTLLPFFLAAFIRTAFFRQI